VEKDYFNSEDFSNWLILATEANKKHATFFLVDPLIFYSDQKNEPNNGFSVDKQKDS
jgi:hypothetical protein